MQSDTGDRIMGGGGKTEFTLSIRLCITLQLLMLIVGSDHYIAKREVWAERGKAISNARTAIPICFVRLILFSYIIPFPMGYRIAFSLVLASAFHSYPLEPMENFSKTLWD